MFGSAILEAAIGLILIYLFLSLVVTAVQEAIAAHLRWRAENLYDGVRELLCDPKDKQGFAEKIYEHPLIYSLSKGPEGKPSYIPSRTFALALLDLIHPTDATQPRELATIRTAIKKLPPALQQSLTVLLDESGDNLERFKVEIEEWFNGSMERVSGWYKRHSQAMLLWLAIGTVVLFNVDSLELAHRLMRDPALRSALVAQAEQAAKVPVGRTPERCAGSERYRGGGSSCRSPHARARSTRKLRSPESARRLGACATRGRDERRHSWALAQPPLRLGADSFRGLPGSTILVRFAEEDHQYPHRRQSA